ncbi:triacylglycerol acidic lipase TAL3 [Tripterygium wilfordii]|uniref:Triacylglycerol acidic lipase TAL3 n=1 Tax=Tripterygium wilfordii TaxID=458696 RepID=A0A7J7CW27_TRIWF|nr:triacylglycerol lipase OBL1-like [Tripterygium wilfordii]KAF5738218.1 triacylglycerol acidic lipase TAL3 [Tripterygium wilfordii]
MECDKSFSRSHMLLKPEEVKFVDLFKILFSSNIENRKFVDCKAKKEEKFDRRWIIFISILAQKVLQFLSTPLSIIGSLFETWLNLLSNNGGFLKLLLNVLRGKVVVPDRTSASFVSCIGNFDKRMELDSNIKHEDGCRYFAALSMMASKASYENKAYLKTIVEDHWKMEFLGFYDFWNDYQEKATTQVSIFRDRTNGHDTIVVAFRGTEPFDADAWCSDFDISWYQLHGVGNIHGGFMKSLGLQKCVGWPKEISNDYNRPAPLAYYAIRDMLRQILPQNNETRFIVTGHSLGGALAILFPAVLAFHEEKLLLERLEGVYTFGQPRVGDEKFGQYMEKLLGDNDVKYYRFVYCNDMVPRLPFDDKDLMFKHFGTCVYYDRNYNGKIVPVLPNKNYFSISSVIPMVFNAVCELLRSFTIRYTKGADYKEGWLMRTFRVIGLVVPGVPAHCPQDYVNSTRLGSPGLFLTKNE